MSGGPTFPPLMRGEAAPQGADPFAKAVTAAALGADPGLVTYNTGGETLTAALTLAPEVPLEDAMAMVFAASLGLSDALGALAPPEVGVHFAWGGGVLVNGACAGRMRAAASHTDPAAEPDWLVVGFDLALTLGAAQPGEDPTRTALSEEGCGEIEPFQLIESWSRHTLVWINYWNDEGMKRLHPEWRSKAWNMGEETAPEAGDDRAPGLFMGIDEKGGMILRRGEATTLIPLTAMLEA